MQTIQTEVPEHLYKNIIVLIKEGWFRDEKEVFSEAIRRFVDAHRPEMMEKFALNDVEWGLHGDE
ncbi:MAG: CopG family transcriptional regulator [Thermodesulfobacteriota bacterium]|nr:CopG family transcriptional regulator [Thermodesulfobacteriota bacterium]